MWSFDRSECNRVNAHANLSLICLCKNDYNVFYKAYDAESQQGMTRSIEIQPTTEYGAEYRNTPDIRIFNKAYDEKCRNTTHHL